MTFKSKDYYHAQLPDSKGTLITAGSNNTVHIRSIQLHNINTSNEQPTIYYNNGTNDLIELKPIVKPNETKLIEYKRGSFILSAANVMAGLTDTASKVTCTIMGEEEIGQD